MDKKTVLLVLVGTCLAVFVVGCGKGEEGKGADGAESAVGVAECDAYLKTVEACSTKATADGKAAMESAIKANRTAWKDAAKNADSKEALKPGCKAALDAFIASNPSCK